MTQPKRILVTGGAGYIGAHLTHQLNEINAPVLVLDNLSTGTKEALQNVDFVEGDVGDKSLIKDLFKQYNIETVIHLAALTSVPESVADPIRYFENNVAQWINFLSVAEPYLKHIIFSSSSSVYGIPSSPIIKENAPLNPINPYGGSKLMGEKIIQRLCVAKPIRYVILRYFNVAGADLQGRMGMWQPSEQLLTKAINHYLQNNLPIPIYGTDYPTHDGSAIRDFIHVEDIASAHIAALDYLQNKGESLTLNCGYGKGYSVKEIVQYLEKTLGEPLLTKDAPRRAGDPPEVVADNTAILASLNWTPRFQDLDKIIQSAYQWQKKRFEESQKS